MGKVNGELRRWNMNQTMPIVKVKDLGIALAAYIAQKRRTE